MDSHRHFQHQRQQLSTMHSSNDPNSHSGKGSIYIPIAPQGAGKTTFLSNLNPITGMDASATNANANANANATIGDTIDISIDNQEGVYLPTPIDLFLVNSADHSSPASKHRDILQSRIHNKSISERIYDAANDEMRWVTQRLCNELTQKEFEDKIMAMDRNNATQSVWDKIMQRDGDEDAVDWKQFLVKIVEDNIFVEHDHDYQRLEHVDLFVVECIFKQSKSKDKTKFPLVSAEVENIAWPLHISNQSQSGLMAVSNKLKFLAFDETYHSTSLAWGNTNAVSTLRVRYICQHSHTSLSVFNFNFVVLHVYYRNQEITLQPLKLHKKVADLSISSPTQISNNLTSSALRMVIRPVPIPALRSTYLV